MFILLSLVLIFVLVILLPLLFGELMFVSLTKLHLSPSMALVLLISILIGGLINIPIKSIVSERDTLMHPLAAYGLADFWPELGRIRRETVIAVNVGGCLIPAGLALYQLFHLALLSPRVWVACAAGAIANSLACYAIARPVPGVGIVMPGLVSPLIAAGLALLLAPGMASPVAFVIGVTGPLIGADLMHLRDVETRSVGILSIGGAGTFDGIVLSGIVAAYLA